MNQESVPTTGRRGAVRIRCLPCLAERLLRVRQPARKSAKNCGWHGPPVKVSVVCKELSMHYPHKSSNIKRARKIGFRARMRTSNGRKTINAKRRVGRRVQVV